MILVSGNGGGGIILDTTNFNDILSATENTVQLALDKLDDGAVNVTGDTMSGALDMDGNDILNIANTNTSVITSAAADGSIEVQLGMTPTSQLVVGTDLIIANDNFGIVTLADGATLTTSATPTADAEIANKKYVDDNDLWEVTGGDTKLKTSDTVVLEDTLTIDTDNAEAFLVRQNGDAKDVFRVDTIGASLDPMIVIGPGAVDPETAGQVQVVSQTTNSVQACATYHNTNNRSSQFLMVRAKGTLADPTSVVNGNWIGSLNFAGYNEIGTPTWGFSSGIFCEVDGIPGSATTPLKLSLHTGEGGSPQRRERITARANGAIEINIDDNLATTVVPLTLHLSANHSANAFRILNSSEAELITFSPFGGAVFNEQGLNADFRVEGLNEDHLFVVDAGANEVRMGDWDTNYSAFEVDGTLKFVGNATVFKDINIGAGTLSGPPGLQPGVANFLDEAGADTGIATFGLAVGEGLSGELEMQHDYKEGSDIVFHIHWQGIAAPTGTDKVQWQLTYTMAKGEATLDPVTVITVEQDFDTQYEFKATAFAAITGTAFNIEDQFIFTLQRIAASADEYAGEALLATIGVHYELSTIGSRTILTK